MFQCQLENNSSLNRGRVAKVELCGLFQVQIPADGGPLGVGRFEDRADAEWCRFAVRSALITTNPARETSTPTPERPALIVPDGAQLHALIDAARDTRWEIPVLLAATTGARRGEVLALRWEYVDLDRGRVRIVAALQRRPGH